MPPFLYLLLWGERVMSESGNIKLNPNILNQMQDTKVPLSDLYGIPVFSPETNQMAEKVKEREEDALSQIEKQVFKTSFSKEDQEVKKIREQVFQTQVGLHKDADEGRNKANTNHSYFLEVEIMILIFMVVLLFYQKYRKRKRKKENDTYDCGK